ncbi:MAG TPA: hypothetical protein VG077_17505 [Verrucomicrobiae bacterium]|nr:hypothetical protein [Verrucomicrobiae bacterium]
MKTDSLPRALFAGACAALRVTQLSAADSPREHFWLDADLGGDGIRRAEEQLRIAR